VSSNEGVPAASGDKVGLVALEDRLLKVVSVAASSSKQGLMASDLCRQIVAQAGDAAYPILSRALAAAKAHSFGGGCVEALVRAALRSGLGDDDVLSLLGGADTGSWVEEILKEDQRQALAFFQRVLQSRLKKAESAELGAPDRRALEVALSALSYSFKGCAKKLVPELRKLAKFKDKDIAEQAQNILDELNQK
jgi:hypothetical protein